MKSVIRYASLLSFLVVPPCMTMGCGADEAALTDEQHSTPISQQSTSTNSDPGTTLTQNPTQNGNTDREESSSKTSDPSHGESDSEATAQSEAGTAESDPTSNPFPMGESGETDDETDPEETEGANDQEASDSFTPTDTASKETTEDEIEQFENDGWQPTSEPQAWPKENFADFPHVLPERPKSLKNPNYMPWTSGRGIAVHGNETFVVDTDANTLVVLSRSSGKVKRMIAVGDRPQQVVVAPDGTAFVTLRYGKSIAKVLPKSSHVSQVVNVGTEPYGLALSTDAKTLYVAISGESRVVALQTSSLIPLSNVAVPTRPRGIAVNGVGDVYVTLQYGGVMRFVTEPGSGALKDAAQLGLRTQNPADVALHSKIKLNKQVPTRAFAACSNPSDNGIYVAHIEANPGSEEQSVTELLDTKAETEEKCETSCSKSCKQTCKQSCNQVCKTQGYYGGTVCSNSCSQNCTNQCNDVCNTTCVTEIKTFPHLIRPVEMAVTAIPAKSNKAMKVQSSPPVKDLFTGEPLHAICDQPMDIHHHPTKSLLFVACMGTDNILVFNSASKDPMRSPVAEIKVGKAPNGIAFSADGNIGYVRNAFSYTVSDVDLSPLFNMKKVSFAKNAAKSAFTKWGQFPSNATLTKPMTLVHGVEAAFGAETLPAEQALGRRIFTFARFPGLSSTGFFACNTCHVDGTEDGLVWFTKEGVRQTPVLASKLMDTEPFNWIGTGATLTDNIAMTVTRMGGAGLNLEQRKAVASFILDPSALAPPPNPHVSTGGLTPSQLKGQELFFSQELGCAGCHVGKGLTDGQNWDVGTFTDLEEEMQEKTGEGALELNTPSLHGLFHSAPYFHDGSAKDLYEVLNSSAETMGLSYQLTGQQQDYLVDYLLTL